MNSDLSFEQAVEYIKSLDVFGSVLGLDNMKALTKEIGNVENSLKFIHVTGTNGKGSACAFISNALIEAGYKVGSYNSPSVIDGIDQFKINMKKIDKTLYSKAVSIARNASLTVEEKTGRHPTRFEVETTVAFVCFYLEKCDIVVLETGLGGRDDATNVITTEILHIFMPISIDHSESLGDSLQDIARIKSGIIKNSAPTVICYRGDFNNEEDSPESIIINKCKEKGSKVYKVSRELIDNIKVTDSHLEFDILKNKSLSLDNTHLRLSMKGAYQPANALTAYMALKVLSESGFPVSDENIKTAFEKTKVAFRFEIVELGDSVDIILDGAHNPDGAKKFVDSLNLNYEGRDKIYITGIFKDKDYSKIAQITGPYAKAVYVIQNTKSARSLDKKILSKEFSKYCDNVMECDSIKDAIKLSLGYAKDITKYGNDRPVICLFGSLSWLNDAYTYIKRIKS